MRIIGSIKPAAENESSREANFHAEELPDLDAMTKAEMTEYLAVLEAERAALDQREPKRMTGSAHEAWEDEHEELEDLIDEVRDCLDEMKN